MRFRIEHLTRNRYARPVALGRHRLMVRPRDSHDLRLLDATLELDPLPAIRWLYDVHGNSVALLDYPGPTDAVTIRSAITVELFGPDRPAFPIDPYAATYPFSYPVEELPDLSRLAERHYPDPDHAVDRWAKRFATRSAVVGTQALLEAMGAAIKTEFRYEPRFLPGTQPPALTLARSAGTCRDYALLMMEAARALGFAARFVSGYVFDPVADLQAGSGSTHAWVQIYLPGAGWVEFDPTNGLVGTHNLIRVAVARDPDQAIPVQGSYLGTPDDSIEQTVLVSVRHLPPEADPPAVAQY